MSKDIQYVSRHVYVYTDTLRHTKIVHPSKHIGGDSSFLDKGVMFGGRMMEKLWCEWWERYRDLGPLVIEQEAEILKQ